MDFKCRDCGEIHDVSKKADRRLSICNFCFEIRGRVLQAVKANEMPIADFQKYQKNGMRSKRLVGMGYGHLVMPSPQAAINVIAITVDHYPIHPIRRCRRKRNRPTGVLIQESLHFLRIASRLIKQNVVNIN